MTSFGLEMLDIEECRELLRAHSFGRVAVWSGPHPAVLPVLYGVLDGDIIIRTAPGEKLIAAVLGQEVVFEIDGAEPARHAGWSVNVVGHAARIESHVDLERAAELDLEPWAGDWRNDYVRIRAEHVSGRRIMTATGALTTGP
jgi:nitroimidazol reductase NimA-like FMN-containing flavoprotein (pyridoxamine 5'-phosphate oxidase superfamily)